MTHRFRLLVSTLALALGRHERFLLAVNAGSGTLSVFEVRNGGLRLIDVKPTGGAGPVSVTEHRGIVYVLNAGSDSIAGFRLAHDGRLLALSGSTRALSRSRFTSTSKTPRRSSTP